MQKHVVKIKVNNLELSEKGVNTIDVSLRRLEEAGLPWSVLWEDTAVAKAIRDEVRINLSTYDKPEVAGALMGATAVVHYLQEVAVGDMKLAEAKRLLKKAGLLTEKNFKVAASMYDVTLDQIQGILGDP